MPCPDQLSDPVENNLAALAGSEDVERLLELRNGWVMIEPTSSPLCNIAAILYQVSKIWRP